MIACVETLCCTTKYRKLIGLPGDLSRASISTSALGPWYANVLNIGSSRMLHYMSSTSLLSVVIWQRERKTAEERFARSLRALLEHLGVAPRLIDAELSELATLQYTCATDRSVLGSMQDQGNIASYHRPDEVTLVDLSARLAKTPCGARDYESPETLVPRLIAAKWDASFVVSGQKRHDEGTE